MQTDFHSTPSQILCCMCGVLIPSNDSNMCIDCIKSQVDITEGIAKQNMVQWCKSCGRYLNPPSQWIFANLESAELLGLCLKRVRGLNKVKLIDAGFVWTEPHSKRLKVKLTIQKEVFRGTILQQTFIIEYVIHTQMCEVCHKKEAKDTWNAVVQLRQKVDHKRTFLWLEQIILKHGIHKNISNIKERPDGLDFYYQNRSHAMKFIEFLNSVIPIRYKTSEKLVSQDDHSNTANLKHSFSVEIIPICRDDCLILPIKTAASCGTISPLVICTKISTQINVIDPLTLQTASINSQTFWSLPFKSLCTHKQLEEFSVLDIQSTGQTRGKYVLAEVQVVRASDFGKNDQTFMGYTHLGAFLKAGDTVLGYDMASSNWNNDHLEVFEKKRRLPDFILVRKTFPEKRKKRQPRHWKIKTLPKDQDDETSAEKENRDMEMFLRDVEEDEELQSQVNLYRVDGAERILKQNLEEIEDDMNDEEFQEIPLDKLMDELSLGQEGNE